jgi:hypothetical protein
MENMEESEIGRKILLLLKTKSIDLVKKIMLDLDYDMVIDLCYDYEELKSICENGYFWRDKILKDFRNAEISSIPLDKMRFKYLLLLGREIDQKANKYGFGYQDDPKYTKLNEEFRKLRTLRLKAKRTKNTELIGDYDNSLEENIRETKKIEKVYTKKEKELKEIADDYFRQGYKELPIVEEEKAIYIYMTGEQFDDFMDALEDIDMDGKLLETYLNENGLYNLPLKSGNLLVYMKEGKKIDKGDAPLLLSYIHEYRGDLIANTSRPIEYEDEDNPEVWEEDLPFIRDLLKYSIDDLIKVYDLKFKIVTNGEGNDTELISDEEEN